ncbi:kinase-like protein [Tothia fuscella]|uniref:non-specific serine/threonine protein kinase n=1 Tax=Tothia fuscella TaxID=1048955 RepID=A0A9P4U4W7_9PEZI|nr:kinase-like protein [Tothia fuscella]
MEKALLNPRLAGARARQIQDAKAMQQVVAERLSRKGLDVPPYEFQELIGKGSYGRVYKSKNRNNQQICAVKIIEVDEQDYNADITAKDDSLKEFIRETSILQALKDNNAQNVNIIFDAFSVDTQLWIVSEYCPGGSLTTLMKATPRPGLDEQFIIPIAREVAVALKYVHDAGIIHRDIKCANILVTEDGRIQLCDFGISGVMEHTTSKRSTIVGTPHWMAPELVSLLGIESSDVRYGTEIDCWAFGCAVYEMSTGHPPNARVRAENLGVTLHSHAPRLEDEKYSPDLQDFAAFCLETTPDKRPTSEQIMQHAYIANTTQQFPTESIRRLIENYAVWEQSGGVRQSLFNPMGPAGPEALSPSEEPDEEWNFSTTMEFDRRISMHLDSFPDLSEDPGKEIYGFEKIIEEARTKRGEKVLNRLFNQHDKPYSYGERGNRMSDLPLRSYSDSSGGDRTTMIDLDAAMPTFDSISSLELVDPPTLRARARRARDRDDDDDDLVDLDDAAFQTARPLTQDWNMNLNVDNDRDLNRRTQDWTFPKMVEEEKTPQGNQQTFRKVKDTNADDGAAFKDIANNRRTQDWKFPTAEEMKAAAATSSHTPSFTSPDIQLESPRPHLRHAATMPRDFGMAAKGGHVSSPDRESMIDLDSAMATDLMINIPELSRPSTSHSSHSATNSAATDMTSGDPFDLEEQIMLSRETSRSSLHMKSQSEPTAGFLDPNHSRTNSREYGSDLESVHNRSSSMNRSDRDRSTSRPPGTATRYRARRPTALQKHWLEKHQGQGSGGSTAAASRAGSFDSTMSGEPTGGYNMSWDPFGDTDEEALKDETRGWQERLRTRARRQKPSDGASTVSIKSDEYLASGTIRPMRPGGSFSRGQLPPPMRLPYEPNRAAILPGGDERLMAGEISRLIEDFMFQADTARQTIMYYGQVEQGELDERPASEHARTTSSG